ncbi:LytTR family DNA-binding domain-containing protein [Clostridium sp. DSM 100503]|uniref:LytR/AlgR family response regulator transcription factor n=1 Tax=Clostridium sp. DSM 100503 TaxID=2963282 RepID=UPI002149B402|nr:LytTR family DNA-binding domain-containing protein [Clostridium sp. DSM 100503]MCR1951302.1 LytTR family DNA-binding domain-containing protein [Clostridium sp. DSM 100503]
MYKIAVCDDEILHHELISNLLNIWRAKKDENIEIVYYQSAEEFLFYWEEGIELNIVLIDIKMRQMSGIELAKRIRSRDKVIDIVFCTADSSFVFEGYEVKAMDYLLKPLNYKRLENIMDKSYNKYKDLKEEEYLVMDSKKKKLKININEIKYFIMFSHYIDVVTLNQTIKWKKKISELEEELKDKRFVRCHRSYIVNMDYVKIVKKSSLVLEDNTVIPISISRLDSVRNNMLIC